MLPRVKQHVTTHRDPRPSSNRWNRRAAEDHGGMNPVTRLHQTQGTPEPPPIPRRFNRVGCPWRCEIQGASESDRCHMLSRMDRKSSSVLARSDRGGMLWMRLARTTTVSPVACSACILISRIARRRTVQRILVAVDRSGVSCMPPCTYTCRYRALAGMCIMAPYSVIRLAFRGGQRRVAAVHEGLEPPGSSGEVVSSPGRPHPELASSWTARTPSLWCRCCRRSRWMLLSFPQYRHTGL